MANPKPKPTLYQGVEFRSRLEARWAVFFDAAGIAWNYEPRWINLPSGPYLPDFILPELRLVVEVKPEFSEAAILRLAEAIDELIDENDAVSQQKYCQGLEDDTPPYFAGLLLTQNDLTVPSQHSLHKGAWITHGIVNEDAPYWTDEWWCECLVCGRIVTATKGWVGGGSSECADHHPYRDLRHTEATPKLRGAYQAAMRAFGRV